jgi:peptide/nickel transport system substrate-binding protein
MKIRLTTKRLTLAMAVLTVLGLLTACGDGASQQPPVIIKETVVVEVEKEKRVIVTATPASRGQIVYALYPEPQILNPFIATQTAAGEANSPVVEGLLGVDPDGNRYPVLAKEVPTVENGLVSEDGLTITYNLRDGIVWSDGQPFTCDDVKFTWEAVVHPESGAVSTTGYTDIESVECPDDLTVVIQFKQFYAPYLSLFDSIMPRHATGDPAEMQKWVYNWHPIGTGPFKIQEWVSGDHITYVPNENYRDYPNKPQLDKLIIRIIPSLEAGKALIRTGEIDILWDLTEADVPEFEGISGIVVNRKTSSGTERLVLNLANPELDATDDPVNNPHWALGDLRVRQAIQHAIDKEFINQELLYGLARVGTNELNNGWAMAEITPSEYSPEKAEELLKDAGWTDEDSDGVRECHGCLYAEEGRPLRLKIQTTTGDKLREETGQVILERLGKVGIELFIENVPSSVLFGSWASDAFRKHGNFDILMYTTRDGIDPHSQVEGYFASWNMPTAANDGAGFNYSRWVDEKFDALVKAAGATPNLEERRQLYQQAMERVAEGLPHIYLYDHLDIHLSRARVQGFQVNPWDNQTWNVEDWAVSE